MLNVRPIAIKDDIVTMNFADGDSTGYITVNLSNTSVWFHLDTAVPSVTEIDPDDPKVKSAVALLNRVGDYYA
jgi:hypothetical protein